MKPELMLLLWAVALTVVQMLIAVSGATFQVGLPKLASNRDNMPALNGWVGAAGSFGSLKYAAWLVANQQRGQTVTARQ